jgi:serine/threonine protein kinase
MGFDDSDNEELRQRVTYRGNVPESAQVAPPLELGRYRDPVEIGRGGMGVVWRLWDTKLERPVAVKRVLPGYQNDTEVSIRLLAEAKALAKLNHPSIVAIYDQSQDELGSYIVTEYVEGTNLLRLVKQQGSLTLTDSIRVIRSVCEGLWEAHQLGIIHRDIKPTNILVDSKGRVKLTDFGLARTAGAAGISISGRVPGTECYMAPEQFLEMRQATALSDQYSLAVTLYETVTGRSPRMINMRYVPEELQGFLERSLQEDPQARFGDLAAFDAELGRNRGACRVQP